MFIQKKIVLASMLAVLIGISGCGGGGGSGATTSVDTSLNGVAQKGPFLKDSNVTVCKLDTALECTSEIVKTQVTDDEGSYRLDKISWSGFSKVSVSGYYFDEVTGAKSLSPTSIEAIIEIKSKVENKNNVNIFTKMQSDRMKELVTKYGKTYSEAQESSAQEIKSLFGLNSGDFTALNLKDFTLGKASINVDLLRISAAIAKSTNPIGDLEELMKIYNEGGLAAVLESSLYKKLMQIIEDVDMNETLTTMGITSEIIDDIPSSELTLSPFARARMSTQNSDQVVLSLFGTTFNTSTPQIVLFDMQGGSISIESMQVADNNRSVVLDMNKSSSCQDINITFSVEYMDLVGVDGMPLETNRLRYSDPMLTCDTSNNNGTPIVVPNNELPIAIIGMEYMDEEQDEVNITAYVGERVPGLESSYSHDRDPYPFGGITHCQWEYNGEIVKESDDVSCDLYNKVFESAGVYDYTLTVTDKVGATDSNVAHITVVANSVPVVAISPSQNQTINVGETLNLNATASDADAGDSVTLQWMYQKVGTPTQYGAGTATQFSHTFNEAGDYNVSVIARDTHNATATASLMVSVNVPQGQNSSPEFNEQNSTLNLSSDIFLFTFNSNPDWVASVTSVSIQIDGSSELIVLNSDDYTLVDGRLTLNVENSNNPALHLAYSNGIKIIISADGYSDANIFIDTVEGGFYEAKAILSSQVPLEENSLDDVVVSVSLTNSLAFINSSLNVANFTFEDAPQGLSVQAVEYIDQRYANITLSFDGTDIDVTKELSVRISKEELSSPTDITTNSLNIYEETLFGYDDINRTIAFHSDDFIHLSIGASESFSLSTLPSEGDASAFKIGNEYWGVDYAHTSCKLSDKIVYDSTNGKGNINIDIEVELPSVADENISINSGSSVHEYLLVSDSHVKSVYIYPAEHGTASVIYKDGAYLLNYEPDSGFLGTEKLTLTINNDVDGCIVSSNIAITINVSLVKNYEMFSALDENDICHPYVTDGETTQEISSISLQHSQCLGGGDEYKKVGNKFVFSNVGGSPLYRVNPATLAFSSWSDYYADMERSLIVKRKIYNSTLLGPRFPYYQSAFIHTAYVNDIGTMPWALKTVDSPYLIDDVVGDYVDGDQIVSNYMQNYTYSYGFREMGSHIYAAAYDWANGNGLSLRKECAFTSLQNCTTADSVLYSDVNSSQSNTGTSSVSVAVDKRNFVYVFDNEAKNLWVTVDLNLDVLSMSDQTRYMEDINFSSMDLQRGSDGVVYYDGFNSDTNSREIGYLYNGDTISMSNIASTCSSNCSESVLETIRLERFFENSPPLHKIATIDKAGSFFLADNKIYVLKNMGAPQRLLYWYELDDNGTLTELPSQTSEDSKAAFKAVYTMEYINGYIYIIGSDRYDSSKTKMVVIETKNDNEVTLIEEDKSVTLYLNELYKNDYNFRKVIYKTKESDGNGAYIYNVYGYNPYKNEKTLLQTYTAAE